MKIVLLLLKHMVFKNTMKKGQISYNWIFAVVAGSVIIFLAIFAVSRFIETSRYSQELEFSERMNIILNPLETGSASAKATEVFVPKGSELKLECTADGIGKEELRFFLKGRPSEELEKGVPVYDKFIFSNNSEKGNKFYLLSKPLEIGFRVANLIYFTPQKFCFVNAPKEIEDEITRLNLENIEFARYKKDCNNTIVCFSNLGKGCEIIVIGDCWDCENIFETGNVEKQGKVVEYAGIPLLYGAIFSSPEIYNCNIHRLIKRANMLSLIYLRKAQILDSRGCGTGPAVQELSNLVGLTSGKKFNLKLIYEEGKKMIGGGECYVY